MLPFFLPTTLKKKIFLPQENLKGKEGKKTKKERAVCPGEYTHQEQIHPQHPARAADAKCHTPHAVGHHGLRSASITELHGTVFQI